MFTFHYLLASSGSFQKEVVQLVGSAVPKLAGSLSHVQTRF
jgi:hypothetical protein